MELQQKTTTIKGNFPKFRIWDKDKKKFYYSADTLIMQQKEMSVVTPFAIPLNYKIKDNFVINLTEFTGILDSTPKLLPIYTGDIVTLTKGELPAGQGVVKWLAEAASFNVSIDLMSGHKIIIIGNIFEDKQLLPTLSKPRLDLSGNIGKALNDTKKLPN